MKIFADGANFEEMRELKVDGFTTNPSLMKKIGVNNYSGYIKWVLELTDKPISFEILSDDFVSMEREARKIASFGDNIYVKIPITNTEDESSVPLIRKLSKDGIKVNATAILTIKQVIEASTAFLYGTPSIISVFAGRIADTGRDPTYTVEVAAQLLRHYPKVELLWASTREVWNIRQAEKCGCHIITVPPEILKKMSMFDKDLTELSLDTIKQFHNDAAGYEI